MCVDRNVLNWRFSWKFSFTGPVFVLILSIRLVSTTVSCIENSLSMDEERSTFLNMVRKGKNVVFMDLIFNQSVYDDFIQNEKDKRWVWVAKDYQYVFRYPENVDVFSFGLLKAKQDSFTVHISIGDLSKACKLRFDDVLADYISHILWKNRTLDNTILNSSTGYTCHSMIDENDIRDYISDISAVKIGYHFVCYMENNQTVSLEKSYMNGIVIFLVLFVYSFYPLFIEMAFYIEDRKIDDGYFFKSESPYSPSVVLTRILFSGNNKYLATLRIIMLLTITSGVGLITKAWVYDYCNCSLKSSNRNSSFQDAENFYEKKAHSYIFGVLHFFFVIAGILSNSRGSLDDFVIFDFLNICENNFFLKTVKVSIFFPRAEESEKHLNSFKIKKLALLKSYRFWLQIFFTSLNHSSRKRRKLFRKRYLFAFMLLYIIQFLINILLVLGSSLCPVVSNVYVLMLYRGNLKSTFEKYIKNVCMLSFLKRFYFFVDLLLHLIPSVYLYLTFTFSFNIFFYGISYAFQFIIFTLLLAVPQLPKDLFIYIIFVTLGITYVSRFILQFVELYKTLLQKILEIRGQNKIQIEHFNRIVALHFPLPNEVFYLFVKILFCCLFFAIVYENLQIAGYFTTPFGVTSVMSMILIFGPPRLVEELLMTDFTSRVHLKEEEINKEIKMEYNIDCEDLVIIQAPLLSTTVTEEEIETLSKPCRTFREHLLKFCFDPETDHDIENQKRLRRASKLAEFKSKKIDIPICKSCKYKPNCFVMRLFCIFCFGCCDFRFDNEGGCECFNLYSTDPVSNAKRITTVKLRFCCIKKMEVKERLNENLINAFEEKVKHIYTKDNEGTENRDENKVNDRSESTNKDESVLKDYQSAEKDRSKLKSLSLSSIRMSDLPADDKEDSNDETEVFLDKEIINTESIVEMNDAKGIPLKNPDEFKNICRDLTSHELLKTNIKAFGYEFSTPTRRKEDCYFEGDCFFEAVSDQLERLHMPPESAADLRHNIVRFCERKATLKRPDGDINLRDFVVGRDLNAYLQKMSKQGEWADHLIVMCMAVYLKRDINVITSSPKTDIGKSFISISSGGSQSDPPLILGHVFENHYESLRPCR